MREWICECDIEFVNALVEIHEVSPRCAVGSADNHRRRITEGTISLNVGMRKCGDVFAPTFCTLRVGVATSCRLGADLVPTSVKQYEKMFLGRRWKCVNALWVCVNMWFFGLSMTFLTYILYISRMIISQRNGLIIRRLFVICIKMCFFMVFSIGKMCILHQKTI